jgi:hypothetical protein
MTSGTVDTVEGVQVLGRGFLQERRFVDAVAVPNIQRELVFSFSAKLPRVGEM